MIEIEVEIIEDVSFLTVGITFYSYKIIHGSSLLLIP